MPFSQIPPSLLNRQLTMSSSLPPTFEESSSLPFINHQQCASKQHHPKQYLGGIGDFNCHSTNWGYDVMDGNRNNHLSLIHDPKLPHSFSSGRWKREYNPDIGFINQNITSLASKHVLDPIPRTQHHPITFEVDAATSPQTVPFHRRFNFRKANWKNYIAVLGYTDFITKPGCVSRKTIPRGCKTSYVPNLTSDNTSRYKEHIKLYEEDPSLLIPLRQEGISLLNYLKSDKIFGRNSSKHQHDTQQQESLGHDQEAVRWSYDGRTTPQRHP